MVKEHWHVHQAPASASSSQRKMVTEMKGMVWAESEGEGKGSTFHIEFPLLPENMSVK